MCLLKILMVLSYSGGENYSGVFHIKKIAVI